MASECRWVIPMPHNSFMISANILSVPTLGRSIRETAVTCFLRLILHLPLFKPRGTVCSIQKGKARLYITPDSISRCCSAHPYLFRFFVTCVHVNVFDFTCLLLNNWFSNCHYSKIYFQPSTTFTSTNIFGDRIR